MPEIGILNKITGFKLFLIDIGIVFLSGTLQLIFYPDLMIKSFFLTFHRNTFYEISALFPKDNILLIFAGIGLCGFVIMASAPILEALGVVKSEGWS